MGAMDVARQVDGAAAGVAFMLLDSRGINGTGRVVGRDRHCQAGGVDNTDSRMASRTRFDWPRGKRTAAAGAKNFLPSGMQGTDIGPRKGAGKAFFGQVENVGLVIAMPVRTLQL